MPIGVSRPVAGRGGSAKCWQGVPAISAMAPAPHPPHCPPIHSTTSSSCAGFPRLLENARRRWTSRGSIGTGCRRGRTCLGCRPRTARAGKVALGQIAQCAHDTTLAVGSQIFGGIRDRFASLRLPLSHGGGTFACLAGRFDCRHGRIDQAARGDAGDGPTVGLSQAFHCGTILHEPRIRRGRAEMVSVERVRARERPRSLRPPMARPCRACLPGGMLGR
jgi:hypothetical protein